MIRDSMAAELASEDAFRSFLDDFENCRIPLAEWSHPAHVAMAVGYLQSLPAAQVLSKVRTHLQNYAVCMAIPTTPERGYHESLTIFWLAVCKAFLDASELTGLAAARAAVDAYGKRGKLHEEYYSFDLVRSPEARAGWVRPDRKELSPAVEASLTNSAIGAPRLIS